MVVVREGVGKDKGLVATRNTNIFEKSLNATNTGFEGQHAEVHGHPEKQDDTPEQQDDVPSLPEQQEDVQVLPEQQGDVPGNPEQHAHGQPEQQGDVPGLPVQGKEKGGDSLRQLGEDAVGAIQMLVLGGERTALCSWERSQGGLYRFMAAV